MNVKYVRGTPQVTIMRLHVCLVMEVESPLMKEALMKRTATKVSKVISYITIIEIDEIPNVTSVH